MLAPMDVARRALSLLLAFVALLLFHACDPCAGVHGYCAGPNGENCANSGDCFCVNKSLNGTCADPLVPAIDCTKSACPAGQTCGGGVCQGAKCADDDQCPPHQQCYLGACKSFGGL